MNKDQIKQLQKIEEEKTVLYSLCTAAKHLILAAKGPVGGPTNWNDTRDSWMNIFESQPIPAKYPKALASVAQYKQTEIDDTDYRHCSFCKVNFDFGINQLCTRCNATLKPGPYREKCT